MARVLVAEDEVLIRVDIVETLTEDQAYTRMRRAAMDRQLPLAEIAKRVLDAQPETPSAP